MAIKFGQISGTFAANTNIMTSIVEQEGNGYISKIGINCIRWNKLDIDGSWSPTIQICFNDSTESTFQIGRTGMLELEDVEIQSLKFLNTSVDADIDYQFVTTLE